MPKHHLDKRAHLLLAEIAGGDDDQLLNTKQVGALLNMSTQWLEGARHRGNGPRFVVLGPRYVRYRRGDIRAWLDARVHAHTREYTGAEERARLAQDKARVVNLRDRADMARVRAEASG
jgi:predicted DNA-binding transcriptional regulator AlpA